MKRIVLLGCLSVACVSGAPPAEKTGDGGGRAGWWHAKSAVGLEPDVDEARFFARRPGSDETHELKLDAFSVEVTTSTHALRSRLDITVKNPGKEQMEAVMRLPIPPGAAVTRAVLYVGEQPMEGAFVARDIARNIYRAITERRRDPALITWHGPDAIDVSVFPVEANKQRRIQLEWVEPAAITGKTLWYRIPVLAHEGRMVGRPDAIKVDGTSIARVGRSWLPLAEAAMPPAAMARVPGDPFGYLFAPAGTPSETPCKLVLVAETSQAMSPDERARQREALNALVAALPPSASLSLLAADFTVQVLAESQPPQQMESALLRLDGIASAGALDLAYALERASEVARAQRSSQIVFLGRGHDAFHGDGTAAALLRLQEDRHTLVLVGGDDRDLPLADVAALSGGVSLAWAQAIAGPERALWGIALPPAASGMANAGRYFPLPTVTGETRWLARFVGEPPAGFGSASARDLAALWTRAHVVGTSSRESDEGQRHRVVTPLTSLLVLESNADYARWGIPEPKAPRAAEAENRAQNLGILGVVKPTEPSQLAATFGRDTAMGSDSTDVLGGLIGEAYGVGGLGMVGTGSGGGGTGEGTIGLGNFGTIGKAGGGGNGSGYGRGVGGLGGRRANAPDVVPGQASVRGSLDKEIIRRIIRRHINEVKYCYESQLVRQSELAGRIAVQFTIAGDGHVVASVLQSSTVGNASVENCVVQAVRRWEFPKPLGGGIVLVSYPFNFVRGDGLLPTLPRPEHALPEPKNAWQTALDELRKDGDLRARLAQVAQMLGAPSADTPAFLAWWLVEQRLRGGNASIHANFLVAELLRQAGQTLDAVRVLSEVAPYYCDGVEAEYRKWNRKDEADRMKVLKLR